MQSILRVREIVGNAASHLYDEMDNGAREKGEKAMVKRECFGEPGLPMS